MSLYLLGIAFAPIYTPHLAERLGRSVLYLTSLFLFSIFILGAGCSRSFASLAVCRFFAGFFGGPCLVLIEGTFADVWSANTTNTYYAVLGLASYVGAAAGKTSPYQLHSQSANYLRCLGPLVGGFVVASKSWRWTQWVTLMLCLATFLLSLGIPETYHREISRRRAKRLNLHLDEQPPESGVALSQMIRITVFTPLKMLVGEPVVVLSSLYLGFNFAVIFQWFITVPVVLSGVYGFKVEQAGLAFIGAIVGSFIAAVMSILIEHIVYRRLLKRMQHSMMEIEYRLIPAMIGGFGITASLFWIGWTAEPSVTWWSPVLGTMVYVWGNMSVLVSQLSRKLQVF